MPRAKTAGAPNLATAVAQRLREFRRKKAWRLEDVAAAVRQRGLAWDASTVAKIEQGRRAATNLDELLVLSDALQVQLDYWIPDKGRLSLTPGFQPTAAKVKAVLRGPATIGQLVLGPSLLVGDPANETPLGALQREALLPAEQKAATALTKRLRRHIYPVDVVRTARRLWDMTLTQRRDKEVGTGSSPQSRANRKRVTTQLLDELEAAMKKKETKR